MNTGKWEALKTTLNYALGVAQDSEATKLASVFLKDTSLVLTCSGYSSSSAFLFLQQKNCLTKMIFVIK